VALEDYKLTRRQVVGAAVAGAVLAAMAKCDEDKDKGDSPKDAPAKTEKK
jgi:hypothetical protein